MPNNAYLAKKNKFKSSFSNSQTGDAVTVTVENNLYFAKFFKRTPNDQLSLKIRQKIVTQDQDLAVTRQIKTEPEQKARMATLLDLTPDTLKNDLAKPLDTGSVINLSLANKYTYQLFKPILLERLKKYVERSAIKQVEGLLKIHTNFDSTHLLDICQTAIRFVDIDVLKVLTKGREDVLKQIELPKKLVDETNTYDFSAVIAAIKSGKNVEEALAKFRANLDKIVKEKGFPFQAMLDAYEISSKDDLREQKQQELLNVQVIGYLQLLSPAWLKKALAKGIFMTKSDKACGDTFVLQSGQSIDPAEDIPHKGLGFDFCVDIFGKNRKWCLEKSSARILKNYLEQKQQSLVNLGNREPKIEKRSHTS